MKNIVTRVAAIQDISGFGRCSLTVIIPILSSMGIQVCPIPTALLSTHTGGFGDVVFQDLTDTMTEYIHHWKQLQLSFEYIYTGFLGNEKQIDKVIDFCRSFKRTGEECIVIDPVMGDHGRLYKTYDNKMQQKMRELITYADIITPNITEMYFLLGKTYCNQAITKSQIKENLELLAAQGPKVIIITGVLLEGGEKANIAYDSKQHIFWKIPYEEVPVHYPGTGDAFTSVLIGALAQGDSLPMAINRATTFISLAIKTTYGYGTDTREGIMLEKVLPTLFHREMSSRYSIL